MAATTVTLVAVELANFTVVPLVIKLEPSITTVVPLVPNAGEKSLMVGAALTTKLLAVTAAPALVLTVIGPSAALVGTTAQTWFCAVTMPLTGLAPVKVTVVPPVTKLPPKRVTAVGYAPLAGLKELM